MWVWFSMCLGDLSHFCSCTRKCLARNSISRLNEFSFCEFFFLLFRLWINHDCNGIFCCWDLSHALKQLLNARLFSWKSPEQVRGKKRARNTQNIARCYYTFLCVAVEFILNLIYAQNEKERRKKLLNDIKKDYLCKDSFFSLGKDSADVSKARVNRTFR